MALYANSISLINPFVDSILYHPQRSPAAEPEAWRYCYMQKSVYLLLLEPWIQSGVVRVIPNPANVSMSMKAELLADKPVQALLEKLEKQEGRKGTAMIDLMVEVCLASPPSEWERLISDGVRPGLQEATLAAVREQSNLDPIRASIPHLGGPSQILNPGDGLGVPAALAFAKAGWSFFSEDRTQFGALREALPKADGGFEAAAGAFGAVRLPFLNSVEPSVALQIRGEGGISRFRSFLLSMQPAPGQDPREAAEAFSVRLGDEYEMYKETWKDVQRSLGVQSLASNAVPALSAAVGGSLTLSAMGAVLGLGGVLLNGMIKRKAIERQPLNVLLELERKRSDSLFS